MVTAAERLVAHLEAWGVRHVFGVSGANIEDVFVAIAARRPAIRATLTKHEHGAGTAADAYARVGGRLGVVLTTSGAAAMNVVSALAEARASGVPVLAIIGEPPTPLQGHGAFQDTSGCGGAVDAAAVLGSVARWCERVRDPARLGSCVDRAIDAAFARRGPAVLLIAKDVQCATVDDAPPLPIRDRPSAEPVDAAAIAAAAAILRPGPTLILAGDEVVRSGAREQLAALVAALDADVALTPDGRDAFDDAHPRFVGVAGPMGHPGVVRALGAARSCLVVGTRLPVLVRGGLELGLRALPTAWIGADAPYLASPEAVRVGSDLPACLAALASAVGRTGAVRAPRAESAPAPALPDTANMASVLAAVAERLPDGGVVLVDAGNTGASAVHHLRAPRDGRWLVAMGMAGMGYTFGAAIGAATASGRRCTVVAGDGAFYMHGLEIHTAVEHRLPITYVILDNRAHGMCLVRERLLLRRDSGCNAFGPSHLGAGLAAMFPRLFARDCRDLGELRAALAQAAVAEGPSVLCVQLRDVEVPPFAPFQQAGPGVTVVDRGGEP